MKRSSFVQSALVTFAGSSAAAAAAPTPEKTYTADDVRALIAANEKIVSPHGVQDLVPVQIGGITQWLSIRGRDARNPVLLFLHGGPGSPEMPEAWTWQRPWEDYFTVVEWDQRGTGKTYASNPLATLAKTTDGETMVRDAEAVVAYLLRRFEKKKLFALGHSWGSHLGMELARRMPEKLYAYVGTGQMIDSPRSEAIGWSFALDAARKHGNAQAVRALEALAPYPGPRGSLTIERIGTQRKWLIYYGGLTYGRHGFDYDANLWKFSPEYTMRDLRATDAGSLFSLQHLLPTVERIDYTKLTQLACPLFLFMGPYDYETSYRVAKDWYARVNAPTKAFVTFPDTSHMTMLEAPGRYLHELVTRVRPLAVAAGDAAPDESVA